MKDVQKAIPTDQDAGLKRILLCCEGYDPVPLIGRPMNYYAPVELCHDFELAGSDCSILLIKMKR